MIEVTAHRKEEPRAGGAVRLFGHLKPSALAPDGVVLEHDAFFLEAEDLIEIDAAESRRLDPAELAR